MTLSIPEWTVSPRILVADIEYDSGELMRNLLRTFKCTVDVAKDGPEAVEKAKTDRYHLILIVSILAKIFRSYHVAYGSE